MNNKLNLKKIYHQIPKTKPGTQGCDECCGPVAFIKEEAERAFAAAGMWPSVDDELKCCYLIPGGGCKIYDVRPLTCRLYGATKVKRISCDRGVKAIFPLTEEYTMALMKQYSKDPTFKLSCENNERDKNDW